MKTYPVYLKGELTITVTTIEVTNPANREVFASMSAVDRPVVAQAIRDAHASFAQWRQFTGKGRGELLHAIASELHRRREEVARLITLENGKPLTQSQGEIAMSIDPLRWFAEEARRSYGRIVPPPVEGKKHLIIKTPIAVVVPIIPST